MNQFPKFVNVKELSQILGKSENSIRYYIKMGYIKPTTRYGRVMSFDPNEVINRAKRFVAINSNK